MTLLLMIDGCGNDWNDMMEVGGVAATCLI